MADVKEMYEKLETRYFGEDMHEKAEIQRLPDLLKGVKTFVDVGSSLGQYVYFGGKILSKATFYSIEPDIFKVKRLRELIDEWQEETDHEYHIINKAVSDRDGVIKFMVPADHDASGALFRQPRTSSDPSDWIESEIECTTLDSLFHGVDVDFVKMDIEGAEHRALRGAKDILKAGRARFLIEIAPWGDSERSYKPSDVFKFMTRFSYGFEIFETHYLFSKTRNTLGMRIKNRLMGFILDHPNIRDLLKKILFLFRKIT